MMQPTFPTVPVNAAAIQGLLPKPNGGLGVDASDMTWPVVSYHRGVLYPFGSGTWYPQTIAYSPSNFMDSDPALALRYPWPEEQRFVGRIEVQISAAVGADEDFEVQLFGAVYTSGLISASSITALDGSGPAKLTFAAGDTSTKRSSTFVLAVISAVPITHIVPGVTPLGSSFYPGEISVFIHSAP